jgi:hypothetical protein
MFPCRPCSDRFSGGAFDLDVSGDGFALPPLGLCDAGGTGGIRFLRLIWFFLMQSIG